MSEPSEFVVPDCGCQNPENPIRPEQGGVFEASYCCSGCDDQVMVRASINPGAPSVFLSAAEARHFAAHLLWCAGQAEPSGSGDER